MKELILKERVKKFLKDLPQKHQTQIKNYIFSLLENPRPHDVKSLKGHHPYLRGDIGEYIVIYWYGDSFVEIMLIGKRNDDEVFRIAKRILK